MKTLLLSYLWWSLRIVITDKWIIQIQTRLNKQNKQILKLKKIKNDFGIVQYKVSARGASIDSDSTTWTSRYIADKSTIHNRHIFWLTNNLPALEICVLAIVKLNNNAFVVDRQWRWWHSNIYLIIIIIIIWLLFEIYVC